MTALDGDCETPPLHAPGVVRRCDVLHDTAAGDSTAATTPVPPGTCLTHGPFSGPMCHRCATAIPRSAFRDPTVPLDALADLMADRDRLRGIIARLYMQRSLGGPALRVAIRSAFGEANRDA